MKNKLRLGFLTVIALTWAICIHAVLSSMGVGGLFLELQSDVVPGAMAITAMEARATEIKERTVVYILRGNITRKGKTLKEWLQEEYEGLGEFAGEHLEHERHVGLEERQAGEEIASLCQKFIAASSNIIELKDLGAGYEELIEKMETDFRPIFSPLRDLLQEHVAVHQQELSAIEAAVHAKQNTSIRLILLTGILVTFVAVAVAVVVDRNFAKYATQQKKTQKVLEKQTNALKERLKELNCLYGISDLVQKEGASLEKILKGTVNLIPPSWRYPETTCARITLKDQTFQTNNFRETAWKQTADIRVHGRRVGTLEVCYLEERPESYEGPFLKEERDLINAVAERLGKIVDSWNVERELRIKEEAIASSINAITLTDLEGNLTYVNRSFLHMWEYDEDKQVIGKPVAEMFQEEEKVLKIMEVLRKKKSWTGELVARRENGSTFNVQLLASTVRNEVGEAICIMACLVDITERKKIEQMKDDFVSLASHELRTPLTSIGGYAELMLDGDVGEINKEQKEFLEIISQNTQRLEALINDVLDIEKIESGRIKLKREKVNLNEIVGACVDTFKVMAEGKGLKLEKEIKAVQMDMLGDSDRLSQVFSNLLSNAIKYTKKGKVKVTAQTKGKFASVTIEDTGVGMSKDELRSVFTRFFRGEDSYVRKTTGTGLGLSIAKATVERHNGDIRMESKLGVGTKFEVILPLLKEAKKGD